MEEEKKVLKKIKKRDSLSERHLQSSRSSITQAPPRWIETSARDRIHFLRIYIIYLYVFVCFSSHHKLYCVFVFFLGYFSFVNDVLINVWMRAGICGS